MLITLVVLLVIAVLVELGMKAAALDARGMRIVYGLAFAAILVMLILTLTGDLTLA